MDLVRINKPKERDRRGYKLYHISVYRKECRYSEDFTTRVPKKAIKKDNPTESTIIHSILYDKAL